MINTLCTIVNFFNSHGSLFPAAFLSVLPICVRLLCLSQESNGTVSVANTLSGNIILAERLNYEERTRYLVVVQANVSELIGGPLA